MDTCLTEINSSGIKNLNEKLKTMKLLEENRKKLHAIRNGNDFLDMTQKSMNNTAKIDHILAKIDKIKQQYYIKT